MKSMYLSAALVPLLLAASAQAQSNPDEGRKTAWEASRERSNDDMVSTGVARARDRLDSATSTSSLRDAEIVKISPTSLGDLFRTIPGIRAEVAIGETNGNYTIRGLPMVGSGAKYLQFQEDGLPVLEFGDFLAMGSDLFIRGDFSVAQVESIRGGSASTFASNAPGGVINLVSNTGEVEGGSVQVSTGLNFDSYRGDFSVGGHLSDSLRFHVGGYYREAEGRRQTGYNGNSGGQVKFNVTKSFDGGFFRIEGKILDDSTSYSGTAPLLVSGTNDDPEYGNVANYSVLEDALTTSNITTFPVLDGPGNLSSINLNDGVSIASRSIGFRTNFNLMGWSISEHMRYTDNSGDVAFNLPLAVVPAAVAPFAFGGRPGSLVHASGVRRGVPIAAPSSLNGNGLLVYSGLINTEIDSLNNFTNDLRASRVWRVGGGDLTTTVGVYNAEQDLVFDRQILPYLQDVLGGGGSSLVDIRNTDGTQRSLGGALNFAGPAPTGGMSRTDIRYSIFAPYASMNYRLGKLALGASVRFDNGDVEGTSGTNSASSVRTIDVNNDGIISEAERTFAFVSAADIRPVDYSYDYVSYSVSANYRFSQSFSSFARYSKGARAAADRILNTPAFNALDGSLLVEDAAYDPVNQAEVGLKYRAGGLFANVTGFWADVSETNLQILPGANGITTSLLVTRTYEAVGAEFEGGVRWGNYSLTAGATVTDAEIVKAEDPTLVGNTPRRQANFIFQLMPQYETDLFTVGASVVGTTESFSQDRNQLKMPGYATVNAFLQVRPMDRVVLAVNANNLFDEMAITQVDAAALPASGVVLGNTLPGRSFTAAVRYYF